LAGGRGRPKKKRNQGGGERGNYLSRENDKGEEKVDVTKTLQKGGGGGRRKTTKTPYEGMG